MRRIPSILSYKRLYEKCSLNAASSQENGSFIARGGTAWLLERYAHFHNRRSLNMAPSNDL